MRERKEALLLVLGHLGSMFPQITADHLKKIIAGTVASQEGDLEPEPLLQMCIEHVLEPEYAPKEQDIDQDDLDMLNGSQDQSKVTAESDTDTSGNNTTIDENVATPQKDLNDSRSNGEVFSPNKSLAETCSEDEARKDAKSNVAIPVITIVKQVMSVFPDADKWWIIKQCKDLKLNFEDHTISERICNHMFENSYPRKGEYEKGKEFLKKHPKKRSHSETSSPALQANTTIDVAESPLDTTIDISESPVADKICKTDNETCGKERPSPHTLQSAPGLKFQFSQGSKSPIPLPSASTADIPHYEYNFGRSDSIERKVSCENCDEKSYIESTAPCYEGHIICKNCVEKCVKPIISGTKEGEIECPVENCDQIIPVAHAKRALPSILVDIMEEKLAQQNIEKLRSSVDGLFKCPHCPFVAYMEPEMKCFICEDEQCKKATCRYCEKQWDNPDLHISCNKNTAKGVTADIKLPDHWQPMDPNHPGYIKVKLDPTSDEYKQISNKFHMVEFAKQQQQQQQQPGLNAFYQLPGQQYPGPGIQIRSIHRVQNPKLWKIYSLKRQLMLQANGEDRLNEIQLFHGTAPNVVDSICAENFDFRLSGAHGTAMGHGIYFAIHSSTSLGYSVAGNDGIRHMFLARVLTGYSAQSSPAHRRPPKDKRTGRLFDSVSNGTPVAGGHTGFGVAGNVATFRRGRGAVMPFTFGGRIGNGVAEYGVEVMNDAAVYVIFDPMQHYPEYVISY